MPDFDALPHPLTDIAIPPDIATLPKADIHIHQEWSPRLDRVLSGRAGRMPYDWRAWSANLMQSEAPGQNRLRHISTHFPATKADDAIAENFVARNADLLVEGAADGALLVETRSGKDVIQRPDAMPLFRQAVEQVQAQYPGFYGAMIPFVNLMWKDEVVERLVQVCIDWARARLIYGVDLFNHPYDTEADWTKACRIAEKFAAAGLGITIHVAEVAPVNIAGALQTPGVTRLGHATHAGYHPHLLEMVARSGVTVECSLTCNVVFGAAPSYAAHPIRDFVAAGIPVALCTDDPVQIGTTIGREYALARLLGFSNADLLNFTRNSLQVAFIPPDIRAQLLAKLDAPDMKSPAV